MVDVKVRRAAMADTAAMATVWWRAATLGYEGVLPPEAGAVPEQRVLVEEWHQSLSDQRAGTAIFVACTTGPEQVVVGTVAAVADPVESSRGHLTALYVDPGWWGRGVGSVLHEAAVGHMRHVGTRMAIAWVLDANVRARTMFERRGWQRSSTRPAPFPGRQEICYLLTL
jgi:GNAT superfamily N-acetyltransferase